MYSQGITALVKALGLIGAFPTRRTSPEAIVSLMRRLHPVACRRGFVRLGSDGDGGYLVPDSIDGIASCWSAGIGRDSRFEVDCAARGMDVFLADGSVNAPAAVHPRFHFTRRFVGALDDEETMTLDAWMAATSDAADGDKLLKLDIESSEYESILAVPDRLLARCRVIVVEFHKLDHLWSKPFFDIASRTFAKLFRRHACVHVHPNNCDGVLRYCGLEIPPTMEFTFLRRDHLPAEPTWRSDFPHALDCDNTSLPSIALPRCWFR